MSANQQELQTNAGSAHARRASLPMVDIVENRDGIVLTADMPGVDSKDLDIQVNDHVLSIEGDIRADLPTHARARVAEVGNSHYARRFTLSRELDDNKVKAHLDNGVLTLRIPRREEHKPHRIKVRT